MFISTSAIALEQTNQIGNQRSLLLWGTANMISSQSDSKAAVLILAWSLCFLMGLSIAAWSDNNNGDQSSGNKINAHEPNTMQSNSNSNAEDNGQLIKQPKQPAAAITITPKTYRLMNLRFRTAKHTSPDAIVCIPAGFDCSQPPRLLVFLHGLTNTLDDVLDIWKIDKCLSEAPANSVLIMPEWALNPKAYSKNAGQFHRRDFFRDMLKEIISKTTELRNWNIDELKNMVVISYSGGFRAARSIAENNGLDDQISDIVLLDSLYITDWFDPWLQKNLRALSNGKKHYYNFFFDTAAQSNQQYYRLRRMVKERQMDTALLARDINKPDVLMPSRLISNKNILFKHTRLSSGSLTPHMSVLDHYFSRSLKAISLREESPSEELASSEQIR